MACREVAKLRSIEDNLPPAIWLHLISPILWLNTYIKDLTGIYHFRFSKNLKATCGQKIEGKSECGKSFWLGELPLFDDQRLSLKPRIFYMLKDLPEFVQNQVLDYLESNNFSAAKSLHDAWIRHGSSINRVRHRRNFKTRTNVLDFMPEQKVWRIEEMLSAK